MRVKILVSGFRLCYSFVTACNLWEKLVSNRINELLPGAVKRSSSYITFCMTACTTLPLRLLLATDISPLLVYQFSRLPFLYSKAFTVSWPSWSPSLRHLTRALRGNKLPALHHSWSRQKSEYVRQGSCARWVFVLCTKRIVGRPATRRLRARNYETDFD
jgi:hypothetical protein